MSPSFRSPAPNPLPTSTAGVFALHQANFLPFLPVSGQSSTFISFQQLLFAANHPLNAKLVFIHLPGAGSQGWGWEAFGLKDGEQRWPLRPWACSRISPVSAFAVPGEVASPEIRWLPPAYSAFLLGSRRSVFCSLPTNTTAPVPGSLILEDEGVSEAQPSPSDEGSKRVVRKRKGAKVPQA